MIWEYTQAVVPADGNAVQAVCTKAGQDGWELAALTTVATRRSPLDPGPDVPGFLLVFKKPVREEKCGDKSLVPPGKVLVPAGTAAG